MLEESNNIQAGKTNRESKLGPTGMQWKMQKTFGSQFENDIKINERRFLTV